MLTRVLTPALVALLLCAAASAQPASQPASTQRDDSAAEKLGWRLAVQAYSFNRFTFWEAADKAASVGVRYIEAYPGQKGGPGPGMSDADIEQFKTKLAGRGLKLVNYGVTGLPKDDAGLRKFFDWARKIGLETVVTEEYDRTEQIDKLCQEYGINMALHNHPGRKPDTAVKASAGRSNRIGACADTGHWMRTNIKPIDGLKLLDGRIISLHFKDLNGFGGGAHDVVWGTGEGDAKGLLAELKRQGFKGVFSIEYEYHWDNSLPEIAQCVAAFDRMAAEILAEQQNK